MESIPLVLTYDDVLLVPRFSSIASRRDVDCTSWFTRQIMLKAPLVSANMDTVTEADMAIAMATFGGIGVVHRFLPIVRQAAEVARVKRYQSKVIEDPHTISSTATVGEARLLMDQLRVHGLPMVKEDGKLVGMLTQRDVEMADDNQPASEE